MSEWTSKRSIVTKGLFNRYEVLMSSGVLMIGPQDLSDRNGALLERLSALINNPERFAFYRMSGSGGDDWEQSISATFPSAEVVGNYVFLTTHDAALVKMAAT